MGKGKEHRRFRKDIYNAEVHATIIRHLKAGAFKVHAAMAARISVDALNDWLERGRAGDPKYIEFMLDVEQAQGEDAIRKQAVISTAAIKGHVGDWKAAAWDLERKYPKLYGRQADAAVGVTISNDNGEEGEQQRTQVVFYLPDNGRRPVEEE